MSVPPQILSTLSSPSPEAPLQKLLLSYLTSNDSTSFSSAFSHFASERTSSSILGSTVTLLIQKINSLPDAARKVDFWGGLFPYIRALASFTDELQSLEPRYIEACKASHRYHELAVFLQSRPIEENLDSPEIVEYWTSIAEAWIEAGLPDSRDMISAYRKAAPHVFPLSTPKPLLLRFRKVRAVYWIISRDYVKASRDYILIADSVSQPEGFLKLAIVYALLSTADAHGPALLAELLSDERINSIPLAKFLRRFAQRSLIRSTDVAEFTEGLKRERGFNQESLTESILSHNLKTIASFYRSIRFATLAKILEESVDAVIKLLKGLIAKRTFDAVIDQPGELVLFKSNLTQLDVRDAKIDSFARAVQDTARRVAGDH